MARKKTKHRKAKSKRRHHAAPKKRRAKAKRRVKHHAPKTTRRKKHKKEVSARQLARMAELGLAKLA